MDNGLRCLLISIIMVTAESLTYEKSYPILFNFGDSNSDTGNYAIITGTYYRSPYGRLSFPHYNLRPSDGRLIIDFLCESLNISYLSPFKDSLQPNYHNGVNFAVSGSLTLPRNLQPTFYYQVEQFVLFKSRSLDLFEQGKGLMNEKKFNDALYIIDIGETDIYNDIFSNFTKDEITTRIPPIITEIGDVIQILYDNGGRKFWIHNIGPLGCLPQILTMPRLNNSDLDANGCLKTYNEIAEQFNVGLSNLCNKLISEMNNVTIVYTDIYAIKYDLIAGHNKYGFSTPLMACCGYGGPPYNINPSIPCLAPGYQVCDEGFKYISWDGIHYSEAANFLIASKILTTKYSRPKIKFGSFFTT